MVKNDRKGLTSEVVELTKDNEKLRAENAHLHEKLTRQSLHIRSGFWRTAAITLCLVLATLFLMAGNVVSWAGNTLINTDRYVQTVQPILQDSAVQVAIADYTTAKLFNQVDVTAVIQEALPPKADFLAPTLTSQLRNATNKTLQTVLRSDKFQMVWVNTNRTAHDKLLTSIKNSKGDGVVNLQDVYNTLSQNLQGTKLSFLAGKSLPKSAGTITIINAPWVPKARFVVNSVGWLKPVTLLLVAALSAGAIWLARRRRAVVMALATCIGLGMAATLVGIKLVTHVFVQKAPAIYQAAAEHAANIVLHHLVVQTIAILCIAVVVILIAWVTSTYKYATCTRHAAADWFTSPVHRLLWSHENDVTRWFTNYRSGLEWAVVAIVAALTVISEISPKEVVIRSGIILVLVLAIEIIAAPRIQQKT